PSIDGFIFSIKYGDIHVASEFENINRRSKLRGIFLIMESNEEFISVTINKQSIISLIFGILTLLSFCTGVMPIPLTGFV
ncbi:hypothetical protein, partial [Escherichia coli]|uniref:hypothetical protein n=1 Tax=Escherichia coli TaxID=562 RepID=UPI003EC651F4